MSLWLVTNQWLGNSVEGAIVEAGNESEALQAAKAALQAERIDDPKLKWLVRELSLPYIGEFG